MARALLCETVTGRSTAELIDARDAAAAADMVELRLDGAADVDVAGVLRGRTRPVVVTCRPVWEGGRFDGSEEARARLLGEALDRGAEFVDIEWRAVQRDGMFARLASRDPSRVLLSLHDFHGVPADLQGLARAMRASGAGTIKVAVTAARLADLLPLLEIARSGPAVVIGMGEAGVPSRLLAARFGSRWTYGGAGAAPGQIPASRMVEEFGFRRVGAATRVYGVVGSNAMHSLSPAMHNAAFASAGLDAVYVPFCPADFADFEVFASRLGIEGVSVTIPFKRAALASARHVDALAGSVGAANTLRRVHGVRPADEDGTVEWEATNTDVQGFLAPIAGWLAAQDGTVRASVLGAGGAARAVVVALHSHGVRVTVHARRAGQARLLADELGVSAGPWPPLPGSWDLLVNCTPVGGADSREASPIPGVPLDGRLVYDLTYGPESSALVRSARAAGCAAIDGLPMLIAQAERQFEWWTGQQPRPEVMRQAALRALGSRARRGSADLAQSTAFGGGS